MYCEFLTMLSPFSSIIHNCRHLVLHLFLHFFYGHICPGS
jgi:hypothetical protein